MLDHWLALDLDHVKKLSPGWMSAIAGAAAAGAVLVPSHRLLAGLGAGAAMLFIALRLTPCCDGCAAGKGCGGAVANPGASTTADPLAPPSPQPLPLPTPPKVFTDPGPQSPPTRVDTTTTDVRRLFAESAVARCGGCAS